MDAKHCKKSRFASLWLLRRIDSNETKIQEDLVINTKRRQDELIGWIDTGDEAHTFWVLKEKTVQQTLASQVLQIYFWATQDLDFLLHTFPQQELQHQSYI